MNIKLLTAGSLALVLAGCGAPPGADGGAVAPGAPGERPAKLGLCIGCHGDTGISRIPGTPHIAGQDEAYLRRSLVQYRDNRRPGGAMNAAAGSLSDRDIRELAAWYGRRAWMEGLDEPQPPVEDTTGFEDTP
ncbi:MAG: c-type cytochrome [Lysobacteraceae bacterium]